MQKNWKEVICASCGSINDYTITEKSNQRVCTCNGCGKYLGNKPKEDFDINLQRLPFGKYKGELIQQMVDLNYLRWALANCRLSGSVTASIKFKLNLK